MFYRLLLLSLVLLLDPFNAAAQQEAIAPPTFQIDGATPQASTQESCTQEPLDPGIRFAWGGRVRENDDAGSENVAVEVSIDGVAEFVPGTEGADRGTWTTFTTTKGVLDIGTTEGGEVIDFWFDVQSLGEGTAPYTFTASDEGGVRGTFTCDFIFGEETPAGLSGIKWNDANGNGQRDEGEEGLQGWTIQLNGGSLSAVTDASGAYSFTELAPGEYTVREVQQDGWTQTHPQGGSHTVTLESGEFLEGLNFGNELTAPGGISGIKWNDVNRNGQRDEGEEGLQGWTIQLNGGSQSVVTDASGAYSFTELAPGEYTVSEVQQDGWEQTSPLFPNSHSVTLGAGEFVEGLNFGNLQLGLAVDKTFNSWIDGIWQSVLSPVPQGGIGENVGVSIDVTNRSAEEAQNVVVEDELPAGIRAYDVRPPCKITLTTVRCEIGALKSGETDTVEFPVHFPAAGTFFNTAVAVSDNVRGDESSVGIEAYDPQEELEGMADPEEQTVSQGEEGSQSFRIDNTSGDELYVPIRIYHGAGMILIDAASPDGNCVERDEGETTCAAEVQGGGSFTIDLIFEGTESGTFTISADVGNYTITAATVNVTTEADLSLEKIVSSEAPASRLGVPFTYEITVRNDGPADASGISVVDVLPGSLQFVNSRGPSEEPPCALTDPTNTDPANPSEVLCAIGSLAAGEEVTVFMDVKPLVARTFTNTAEIFSADQPDPDSTPDNATPGEDDQDHVEVTVQSVVTKITDPNTVFHRLVVLGGFDNGLENPFEERNRLDDAEEVIDGVFGPTHQAAGSTVTLLEQPRKRDLEAKLDSLKETAQAGEEVTFFFSGHGWNGVNEDGSFTGDDDEPSTGDETIWVNQHESISDDELSEWLEGFDPGVSVVIVLTSCFGGAFADGSTDIQENDSVTLIGVSGRCPQDSWGTYDLLFTPFPGITGAFVQTLPEDIAVGAGDGEADADGDGLVTAHELKTWLSDQGWAVTGLSDQGGKAITQGPIKSSKSNCGAAEVGGLCPGLAATELSFFGRTEASSDLQIEIRGRHFAPNATVILDWVIPGSQSVETRSLGTAITDPSGAFTARVSLSSDVSPNLPSVLEIRDEEGFYDWWIIDPRPLSVTSTGDGADADPYDGACEDESGSCSLRAAVQHANTIAGPAEITFNGGDQEGEGLSKQKHIIRPKSPLPAITDVLVLEGGGAVTIGGGQAPGNTDGLAIRSDSSRIVGITITEFGRHGIVVDGSGNQIEETEITGNGGDGVRVVGGTGNRLLGNGMGGNGGLGIDLGGEGPTSNDPNDADAGPNNLQNAPDLTSATGLDRLTLELNYSVSSSPDHSAFPVVVEFFLADSEGSEGRTLIGIDTLTAGEAQGTKTLQLTPLVPIADGNPIVATATDAEGNTSEFSMRMGASGNVPLPVELASFTGVADGEAVQLTWQTASETNNSGFNVERRPGSRPSWQKVGVVESKAPGGTATEPKSYRFVDTGLPYEADRLIYRLKQVDTDGSTSYSKEVVVNRLVEEVQLLGTYPNPAHQHTTLRFAVPKRQEVTIYLYDVLGRQLKTVVNGEKKGRQKVRLDVSDLSSGVYFLRIEAENATKTQRLTVVR